MRTSTQNSKLRTQFELHLDEVFRQFPGIKIVTYSAKHIIDRVNSEFLETFHIKNYSKIEKHSLADPQFVNKLTPSLVKILDKKILNHVYRTAETSYLYEVPLYHSEKYKPEQYFNFIYKPLLNPDKKVIGILIRGVDVTDETIFRRQVEESEYNLRVMTEAIPQLVWVTRPDGYHEYYNQRWYEYTDTTFEQTKGGSWNKLLHPDDQIRAMKAWRRAIRTGQDYEIEYRLLNGKTKEYQWFLCRAVAIKDRYGKISRWFGTCTNIEQQKTTEQNLAFLTEASKTLQSNLDYQSTLANIAKLAVPTFADWCSIEMLNDNNQPELLSLAHIDPQKVAWARELREKYPPDPQAVSGVSQVLRTGKPEIYPYITDQMLAQTITKPKQLKLARQLQLCAMIIAPIIIKNKTVGVIQFINAESQRRYHNDDLIIAQELAYRAGMAIENARLFQNAQKAIELRDEFISIASHELKTPITSLKVYNQVLLNKAIQDQAKFYADNLSKMILQTDKLTRLISQLLDISRLQVGKLALQIEQFDLSELIHEIVDTIQPSTTHQINYQHKSGIIIEGDRDRIGQVITNLINNATKYSPQADKVDLYFKQHPDYYILSVEDYGIGISEENRIKIFERFFQVHENQKNTYPGMGIGLYISNEIATRHGGKIGVKSQLNKGSIFSLYLPKKPQIV